MRICTVVGARPQFIKAAVVSRALEKSGIEEVIVHTGQHYDDEMSRVFFEELGVPPPIANLEVGSGSHSTQTGKMMSRLEEFLLAQPAMDWLLIYGDTNSTLAGALVASKLHIPLAHVEAGLRSFNRHMPEEINRIVADRLSDLLFCPTESAVANLRAEGIRSGVHLTGDVMLEATHLFAEEARQKPLTEALTHLASGVYYLATIHRAENTDHPDRLRAIFDGLGRLQETVLLPLHPRTKERLHGLEIPSNVQLLPPVSYLEMLSLIGGARCVLTDSGGLQKEAYWLGIPCITLRKETEWIETLENGWNQLVGSDPNRIVEASRHLPDNQAVQVEFGSVQGERASSHICKYLRNYSYGGTKV